LLGRDYASFHEALAEFAKCMLPFLDRWLMFVLLLAEILC
jgi:hypothetical protein